MREILFRGKNKTTNNWVYGFVMNSTNTFLGQYINGNKFNFIEVIPETVGQFINRTDEKGNKLFVGDIVKYSNGEIGVIRYNEYVSAYIVNFSGGDWDYLDIENGTGEIIGNIHDNPELLEVQSA